jgi:DNA-binding NarL/FixJ family response regulator
MSDPVAVFVLVAVRLYREGLADTLARDPRFRVVGSAGALEDARRQGGCLPVSPSVALVDLGPAERALATPLLRALWPAVGVVALAVAEAEEDILCWAESGVTGLVSREATLAEVLDAVEAAAGNQVWTTPAVAAVLLRRVAALGVQRRMGERSALTFRQREILRLMGRGLSNKEIAASLRIRLPTVKNHVHSILERLSVASRTEAISAARASGELLEI